MIYTIAHKPVPYPLEPGTTHIQVGDAETFLPCRDDTGDSIAEWNPLYAENTAIYWIWKNDHDEYKGQMQYRRRLPLTQGIGEGFKVRTVAPLNVRNVWKQYSGFHSEKDLATVENIIRQMLPEYSDSFDRYIKNGTRLYYSNGYLMRSEDYDRWCHFLFGILEMFRHCRGWESVEDVRKSVETDIRLRHRNGVRGLRYQMQVFGFLSERLWTLWVQHNFKESEIQTDPYRLMEDTGI